MNENRRHHVLTLIQWRIPIKANGYTMEIEHCIYKLSNGIHTMIKSAICEMFTENPNWGFEAPLWNSRL